VRGGFFYNIINFLRKNFILSFFGGSRTGRVLSSYKIFCEFSEEMSSHKRRSFRFIGRDAHFYRASGRFWSFRMFGVKQCLSGKFHESLNEAFSSR